MRTKKEAPRLAENFFCFSVFRNNNYSVTLHLSVKPYPQISSGKYAQSSESG